ncbi:cytoplasmic protein [Anaerosalibacter bizertensis]|uniref:cytoplasmic protein n=1 Tax=Anaerosalibacter bizertensis TaxID=932217 RepID=UPI003514D836
MKKVAFFAFNGEQMCFMHLLLNAVDMHEKGMEVKIVMEGKAVKLIKELEESNNKMYKKAKELNLFDSVCKACSAKMGVLEYNENCGIPLNGDLNGHPPMYPYISEGYEIITL